MQLEELQTRIKGSNLWRKNGLERLYFEHFTRKTCTKYKCWFEIVNDKLDLFVKIYSTKESPHWCILEAEYLQKTYREQFHELINDCELKRRKMPVHIRLQDNVEIYSTTPKPHQTDALNFLSKIKAGALFGDTGVGKSKISIDLAYSRYMAEKINKVLVFCPVSTKINFYEQIIEHCQSPVLEWKILGIESMSSSDSTYLEALDYANSETMIIIDESDLCKTHSAIRSERIREVCQKSTYKLIMTATPITDNVHNLYMQYSLLSDYIFDCRTWREFENMFILTNELGDVIGYKNLDYMASLVEPYTFQINKCECLDLPEKFFKTITCELTDNQDFYYQEIKNNLLDIIDSGEYTCETIFLHLTRMQQVVCGYFVTDDKEFQYLGTNKFKILDKILKPDEQYIFFCKYLFEVDLLKEYLSDCAVFTGKNKKERDKEKERFVTGNTKYFVATTSSGGRGLNGLQKCHNLIYFSDSFKYGDKIHSIGRIDRIGQTEQMNIVNLMTNSGIDFKIKRNLIRKQTLEQEVRKLLTDKTKLRNFVAELGEHAQTEIAMNIEILQGKENRLYQLVAPYIMSKEVIAEFDNYPILTDENYTWFLAFDNDTLLGFSAIKTLKSHVEFTNDYILPEYRKKNIHQTLIKKRIEWCKKNKVSKIKADCTNESLPQYTKVGFSVVRDFEKWHKVELSL